MAPALFITSSLYVPENILPRHEEETEGTRKANVYSLQ